MENELEVEEATPVEEVDNTIIVDGVNMESLQNVNYLEKYHQCFECFKIFDEFEENLLCGYCESKFCIDCREKTIVSYIDINGISRGYTKCPSCNEVGRIMTSIQGIDDNLRQSNNYQRHQCNVS